MAIYSSVKLILVYALYMGWILEVLDVEAAFLNAELGDLLYVQWPEFMDDLGYLDEYLASTICPEYANAFYGTTDSIMACSKTFKNFIKSLGHI